MTDLDLDLDFASRRSPLQAAAAGCATLASATAGAATAILAKPFTQTFLSAPKTA